MDIEELSKIIDKYHEEDRDMEWMKLGLIALGFALASTSLAIAAPKCSTFVITAMSILPPEAESLFFAAVIALIAIPIPSFVAKSSL